VRVPRGFWPSQKRPQHYADRTSTPPVPPTSPWNLVQPLLVARNCVLGPCRLHRKLLAMGSLSGSVDQRLLLGRRGRYQERRAWAADFFDQSQRPSDGRNDRFVLYISPIGPFFPPEFATAGNISGIQIARTMTAISPSSCDHWETLPIRGKLRGKESQRDTTRPIQD
jgi:hypothetical protein